MHRSMKQRTGSFDPGLQPGNIVAEEGGLFATVRRTLAQSAAHHVACADWWRSPFSPTGNCSTAPFGLRVRVRASNSRMRCPQRGVNPGGKPRFCHRLRSRSTHAGIILPARQRAIGYHVEVGDEAQGGITYSNAAVATYPFIYSNLRSISGRTITHRSIRGLAIHHAPEHFFPEEYAHRFISGSLDTGISLNAFRVSKMNDVWRKSMGRGGCGRFHSAGGVHGISSLQIARDRVRHAPDPSHRIHAHP